MVTRFARLSGKCPCGWHIEEQKTMHSNEPKEMDRWQRLGKELTAKNRFSWGMRLTALVALFSVAGISCATPFSQAEQVRKIVEAHKPHPVSELKPGTTDKLTPEQWKAVDAKRAKEAAAKHKDVRVLSLKEMKSAHGSGPYRNQYFAGTLPWHRSIQDANLCNGNLFKSFTDIQVATARGAGLALQRTYNSQDDRQGPFGVGWTHAYDIRMQEENPTTNQTDDSLNYADRVDFFGGRHKYHRDCDGLYSPPPYLFDETSSDYQAFLVNGPIVALDDTEIGMDGTTKHFTSVGNNTRACDYIKDRYGNQTNLTYGAVVSGTAVASLLATVTDPSGRQLVFTWVNLGTAQQPIYRISQVVGPQYSVAYAYNADANLASVTLDPGTGHLNRTTSYSYTSYSDANGSETGLLASITDPLGETVTYQYALGYPSDFYTVPTFTGTLWVSQVSTPASSDGQAAQHVWSIQGTAGYGGISGSVSDNAGLFYRTWMDNRLRTTTSGIGNSAQAFAQTYDTANNVLSCTRGNASYSQEYPYTDDNVNIVCATDRFTYGPHGNQLTHTIDGFSGTETTSYYNGSQYFQKQSVTDMNGHTSVFGVGNKSGADPSNPNLTPAPGNAGSVLWVRDAGYNVAGNPSYQKQYTYQYNAYGQKIQETNLGVNGAAGTVTVYSYGDNGDQWGNLTTVIQDPNPTGQTGHLARTTSMTYDVAGHVLTSTDPAGQQSTFAYNILGQPTSASFPATMNNGVQVTPAETVTYSYAANGRTVSVTDNRGTTSMAYEAGCDRVASITDPVTGTISYTYGIAGERHAMTLPGGGTFTYGYRTLSPSAPGNPTGIMPKDDPNSLTPMIATITDDQGRRVDYHLDIFGTPHVAITNQVFSQPANTLSAYQQTVYTFDNNATANTSRPRLTQLQNSYRYLDANNNWQSKLLVGNTYSYDTAGQRLTNTISSLDPTTGNLTSRTEQYTYDAQSRLATVDYGDGQTQNYSFDAMGNRLSKSDSVTGNESYGYNAANMLVSRNVGGTNNVYTNDVNGNTLTGGGRTNTWDSENRLVQCINGNNTSVFTYGSDGLRHRSVVNGTTTDFVLDSSMLLREMSGSTVKATYLMGARGPEYRRDDTTGQVRWYLYDGLGSVLGEVDPNGNITARRKYDAYGATRAGSNAGTSKHKFVGSLGHPSEDETGLIYMQARYYDQQIGRFVSQDPSKNGSNWLSYGESSPTLNVDATGRASEGVGGGANFAKNEEIFRQSLKDAPTFRLVAAAFLAFWDGLLITKMDLAMATALGFLHADFLETQGGPRAMSIAAQQVAFYAGYNACIEITMFFLGMGGTPGGGPDTGSNSPVSVL